MSNKTNAADKVLQILAIFDAKVSDMSVGQIAERLNIHKSTASRLITTLVEKGFLVRQKRVIRLGPELGRLGLLALNNHNLIGISRRAMDWLAGKTKETVHLAVLDGDEVLNIAQVTGPSIVSTTNYLGRRTKLHCAASGKTLLAFSEKAHVHEPLQALTDRTITDLQVLQMEVKQVRTRGWASNLGEIEIGHHAVAVPIFDGSRRCVAVLSVDGPSYRIPASRCAELSVLCMQAARAIGLHLGGA